MRRICAIVILVILSCSPVLKAQQSQIDLGRWKNYTDMKEARSVAVRDDSLWVATAGGLFLYVTADRHITKFTNSEGLSSNDLTAVTIDGSGKIWVGSSDGFLNRYDPSTNTWVEIRDIKDSPRIQKAIRTLFVKGDSLLIGTDFGISVFLVERREFRDTYASFGFATQAKVQGIVVHENRIWAATDLGVASAPLTAPNLSSPLYWQRFNATENLPSSNATAVTVFRDTIVVGTAAGAAFFNGTTFQPMNSLQGKAVADLIPRPNVLMVLWNESASMSFGSLAGLRDPIAIIASNPQGTGRRLALQSNPPAVWVATTFNGIASPNGAQWETIAPSGPQSNLFISIAVDSSGALWAASGISERGRGFYRFDPNKPATEQWKNFTWETHPIMGRGPSDNARNDYYKVSLGQGGSVWVSSWGRGVVEVKKDSILRRLDHATIPMLAGSVSSDPAFVVIGGVGPDSRGNTWIANRTAVNGNHLAQIMGDGSVVYRNSPSLGMFTNIVVDQNNTKWVAGSEPHNLAKTGLYFFNEDTLVSNTRATGGWGWMSAGDGFPATTSNDVLSLAVDKDGDVCVGTESGMILIREPRNPKSSTTTTVVIPLRLQVIQAIAVDALDNKWVGTKEGVIVINSDGTQVVAQYTVLSTNGKLIDNDVRSIAIDQQRGVVYFGTEKGLSSLEILPVQTERSLTSLEIAPNPYIIPTPSQLVIRNLVEDSSVKILSVSGTLISEFRAQGGGRAFWDGRTLGGEYVVSGVYFVVAFAENGNQLGTGKVAVVRR